MVVTVLSVPNNHENRGDTEFHSYFSSVPFPILFFKSFGKCKKKKRKKIERQKLAMSQGFQRGQNFL